MKKSLIALAALAAVSAASAQSSVTMYGVADLSLAKLPGVSTQMSGEGLMNNGGSRLGVRGVEDLGGGLQAAFNFEQGLNMETGAMSGPNPFQRAANLSLMGKFGTFKMGRTLTPSFYAMSAWDLTQAANYSVVGNQFAWAGAGSRNSSEFSYKTPSFGGFTAQLAYVAAPDNGGHDKKDANAIYANGPVVVGLAYNKVEGSSSNVALGGKYSFGAFEVAASFQDPAGDARGFTLGGGATFGAVHLVLDVARDTHFHDTDVVLEAKYALSKRTFAYAAAYRNGNGKTVDSTTSYGLGLRHNF